MPKRAKDSGVARTARSWTSRAGGAAADGSETAASAADTRVRRRTWRAGAAGAGDALANIRNTERAQSATEKVFESSTLSTYVTGYD